MRIEPRLMMAVLLMAMATYGQQSSTPAPPSEKPGSNAKPAPVVSADYKIGPQDVLRVDVWKEPEITRSVPVRPDGKISLPLLNDVQAAGLTSMELAGVIREGLSKYITSPQVTVTVTEINSRRVYCNGEFMKPGALTLLPGMTALQAISTCGGFSQFAKVKSAYILRNEKGQQVQHPFSYKEIVKGKSPDIALQPGDVIVVP